MASNASRTGTSLALSERVALTPVFTVMLYRVPETIDMNTCRAGAALTTRSKRGSTGAPGTFGISARSGGGKHPRGGAALLPFFYGGGSFFGITHPVLLNVVGELTQAPAIRHLRSTLPELH